MQTRTVSDLRDYQKRAVEESLEWLEARSKGITVSGLATALGILPPGVEYWLKKIKATPIGRRGNSALYAPDVLDEIEALRRAPRKAHGSKEGTAGKAAF